MQKDRARFSFANFAPTLAKPRREAEPDTAPAKHPGAALSPERIKQLWDKAIAAANAKLGL